MTCSKLFKETFKTMVIIRCKVGVSSSRGTFLGCSSTLSPEILLIPQAQGLEDTAKLGLFENRSQKRPRCCLGKLDHEFYWMALIPYSPNDSPSFPSPPAICRWRSKSWGCTWKHEHQVWVSVHSRRGDRQQKGKHMSDRDNPQGG